MKGDDYMEIILLGILFITVLAYGSENIRVREEIKKYEEKNI